MTTTFRADVRAGLLAVLDAFTSANPTMLRSTHKVRPEGFTGDYPIGFVDNTNESIFHTSGVRERSMQPAISIVGEYRLNDEHADEFDLIVDAFVDFCTARPHIVTGTIWDRMSVEDYAEEIGEPPAIRPAVRFTFLGLSIQEGRTS